MKKKDAVVIVVSVIIFVIAGGLLYRYLAPPTQGSGVKVIVPHPVDPNFNQEQLNVLKNDVTDYSQNIAPADSTQPSTNSGQPTQQSSPIQPSPARN